MRKFLSTSKFSAWSIWNIGEPAGLVLTGVVALGIYLALAWHLLPAQAVWSPDEGAKWLQMENLDIREGRLVYEIRYPGIKVDPSLTYAPANLFRVRAGKLYFQRLPLWPALTRPLYRAWGVYGLYLLPALGGVFCSMVTLHLLPRTERRLRMWFLIAFGSPLFIYSVLFWEHTVATGLALAAAWVTIWAEHNASAHGRRHRYAWWMVGVLFGAACFLRLEVVIFAVAWLLAYGWLVRAARWHALTAGALLGSSLLLYRLAHLFLFAGQPMPDNATYLFYPFSYLRQAQWRVIPDLLVGPVTPFSLATGWLGVVWSGTLIGAICTSCLATHTQRLARLRLLSLLSVAVISGIFLFVALPYRAAHGLFFTTPWAVIGVGRACELWQQGGVRVRIIVLATCLGLAGYAVAIIGLRAGAPHGGLEWGARFAMTFYPLLALMTAWPCPSARLTLPLVAKTEAIVGALMLLGIGFQVRGLATIRNDKELGLARQVALLNTDETQLVSDLWWLPFDSAPIYAQKAFYFVDNRQELDDWVAQASAQQVTTFALITTHPDPAPLLPLVNGPYQLQIQERKVGGGIFIYQIQIKPRTPQNQN